MDIFWVVLFILYLMFDEARSRGGRGYAHFAAADADDDSPEAKVRYESGRTASSSRCCWRCCARPRTEWYPCGW